MNHERRQRLQSALLAADAARSHQRQGFEGAVAHRYGHVRRPEQLGSSADPASSRNAVHHQRRERRVRARRRQRRDPLDVSRQSGSARRRADGPLEPRRHDGRGQDLRRPQRRAARRLDQRTGEVVWSVEAERWQNGFSITSAPLYYDGMVITGFSGGEMASRGKVNAFSARDARLVWSFNTIPGPGEFGHARGRRTARRGNSAARPSGRRRPSIPSSASSTSRPAIPALTYTEAFAPATTCSASRSWPSTRTR